MSEPKKMAFRIKQNGLIVARVEGLPIEAEAEIMHYAIQYREEGELTIQHNAEGHWKRFMLVCQWPVMA